MVEHSARRNEEVRHSLLAVRSADSPATVLEVAAHDLLAEADVRTEAILIGDALEVAPDLRTRRERVAPVRVELERVLVEARRYVAGESGVGVVPPRAADGLGLLVDLEAVDAGLLELDAHAQARHPGTHDRHRGRTTVVAPSQQTVHTVSFLAGEPSIRSAPGVVGHLPAERGARGVPPLGPRVPRANLARVRGAPADGDGRGLRRRGLAPDGGGARSPGPRDPGGVRRLGLRLERAGAGVRGDGPGAGLR